jgi:hypothetical protein
MASHRNCIGSKSCDCILRLSENFPEDETQECQMIKPRPLPRLRVQLPFQRSFTEAEFLRLKQGFVAESMEDRWHILFKDPWLTFVRSWTGFCVYKVRLEQHDTRYTIAQVWVNRDRCQYGGDDPREEARLLSFLIDRLLLGLEQRSL